MIEIKCPKCGYIQKFQRKNNLEEDRCNEKEELDYVFVLPP